MMYSLGKTPVTGVFLACLFGFRFWASIPRKMIIKNLLIHLK